MLADLPLPLPVPHLAQLWVEVGGAGKGKNKTKKKKAKKAKAPQGGCGGRHSTHADVFGFFDAAAGGRKTRAEVVAQTDWLLTDLELGCTPGLGDDPAVYEKLQSFTWGFLHDGPRTLRGIELRKAALLAADSSSAGSTQAEGDTSDYGHGGSITAQLALLQERAQVLRLYGNRSAAMHGLEWPPGGTDGHLAFPKAGCGGFPSPVRRVAPSGAGVIEDDSGGWLSSKKARIRWADGDSCNIRVLTAAEWEAASPACLAALFTRPFLVQVRR